MIFQEVEEKSSAGNGGEGARKEVGEEGRIVKTIIVIVAIIAINHRHHRDPLLWHWHLKMLTRTVDLFARQLPHVNLLLKEKRNLKNLILSPLDS